jgi:lipopolysaccharide transport system permease protein
MELGTETSCEPNAVDMGQDVSGTPEDHDLPVTVIEPKPGWRLLDFRELWRYRELLLFVVWRDLKVRYKQTVLGAAWAILQPVATVAVLSLVLGRVANQLAGEEHYPLFLLAGLLPWTFFANAISTAALSVVSSQNLVTKVYFPRLIIPMGTIGAALVDFAVAFATLGVFMLYYGVAPTWSFLLVPLLVLGLTIAAFGIGTLLAALTVAYRDFRHIVPFMVQLWMFATPSVFMRPDLFGSTLWKIVLPLNPAYGLIAAFRSATLGRPIDPVSLTISSVVSLGLLALGCLYFRRVERSFADII